MGVASVRQSYRYERKQPAIVAEIQRIPRIVYFTCLDGERIKMIQTTAKHYKNELPIRLLSGTLRA